MDVNAKGIIFLGVYCFYPEKNNLQRMISYRKQHILFIVTLQLFKKLKFMPCLFPGRHEKNIMAILISVFSFEYHGKAIDFEKCGPATVPRLRIS